MKASALLARVMSVAILLFAFGLSVYRAKVQPIAHDEASTYMMFLDQGVYHVLFYDPANHPLFTLMAKPVVWTVGVTEFKLRAPSLFGAAGYLVAIYFLCATLFGDGLLLPLSTALLCLNPQILEFLPAARGYSLGLAFLAAAMYVLAKLLERGEFDPNYKGWRWGCAVASVLLALSVAGSFTNVVPAACLTLVFSIVALGGWSAFKSPKNPRLRVFARYLIAPGACVGFSILWPFLIQFRRGAHTQTNMGGAADAAHDIFNGSFLSKWTDDVHASLGAVPSIPHSWHAQVSDLGAFLILPLLFCLVACGLFLASRPGAVSKTNGDRQRQFFSGAAVACVVLIFLLHTVVKINYPFSRYCLFLIPLFTIGVMLTGRELSARFPRAYLKVAGVIVASIVLFDYAASLNTKYFRYNAYDVISLDLYQAIARDAQARGLKNVRVGGTWWYEPEINFYRRRYRAEWLLPYDIKDRSYIWETPNSLVPADYDYFLYLPACDPGLTGPRVRSIFHDDKTQLTIIALARR
jgi:hypothetical protein